MKDPRNAPLAAAWAEQLLALTAKRRRPTWLLVEAVLVAAAAFILREPRLLVGVIAALMLFAARRRNSGERLQRAATANRELAVAFALEVPVLPPLDGTSLFPPIVSRQGAIAIAATIVLVAIGITVAIATRGEAAVPSKWAQHADRVCLRMADMYRHANKGHVQTLSGEVPLSELAEIRRQGATIEEAAVSVIRASGPVPPGAPSVAVDAFRRKIHQEWKAVRAADRGDRAAYDRELVKSVVPAVRARDAFAESGATVCSGLM